MRDFAGCPVASICSHLGLRIASLRAVEERVPTDSSIKLHRIMPQLQARSPWLPRPAEHPPWERSLPRPSLMLPELAQLPGGHRQGGEPCPATRSCCTI